MKVVCTFPKLLTNILKENFMKSYTHDSLLILVASQGRYWTCPILSQFEYCDISSTILIFTSSDHGINLTITIVLRQAVLQHLLTDFEVKLLILIQSVDEIKTHL